MARRVCRVARWGAAVRRLFLREDHASSKLIRSFPAALQGVECVLGARLRSGRLVGPAVACSGQFVVLVSPLVGSWVVAGAGRWLFQASESAVRGTALGRKGVEPQAPPPSGGQGCPCRSRSRLVRGARPALLSVASALLSSASAHRPAPHVRFSPSWRLPP
jgi:hypothetical protein